MKKNSRLKSFFAILLAVSMIFQQSSLTVLATDDTYVEDATATPTPSENEAETYATEGAEPNTFLDKKSPVIEEHITQINTEGLKFLCISSNANITPAKGALKAADNPAAAPHVRSSFSSIRIR